MDVGYVRISTRHQNTARQDELMKQLGVEKVYTDKLSGKNRDRPELRKMLDFVREGDRVIVESTMATKIIDLLLGGIKVAVNTLLTPILEVKGGPIITAAWSRDTATKERRLCLVFIYPDGMSDIKQFRPSKLTGPSSLRDLLDMDGMTEEAIVELYKRIKKTAHSLDTQADNAGKQPMVDVYRALCEYVDSYMQPGKVFVRDGVGYIDTAYLPTLINHLELGYTRLELEKALKLMGLLITSENSGHPYSYAVNIQGRTEWFLAFKLPNAEQEVVYEH